jgi:hypothetical protein
VKLFAYILAVVALSSVTWAGTLGEAEKIALLIRSVEEMPARFIRNGTEYEAKEAAAHLRLKLSGAGSRVKTAEDFIKYCGSQSFMSGEKYKIKFPDGRVMESEVYLRERLSELESAPP